MKHRIFRLLSLGALVVAGLLVSPPAQAQSTGLTREIYTGIPGNDVAALTSAPTFPDRPASRDVLTDFFETGQNIADNYGQRIRGFLSAPQSGDYVFWIASDDHSVLYLSTSEDPAQKREIAAVNGATGFRNWFNESSQQSAPVRLEAGRLYYVEALMKEGGGSDHFSVRWALPLGGIEEPVPASNFLPAGTPLSAPRVTRQPASVTVTEGQTATFRVEVSNTDPVTYQWQRNNVPIPDANGATLTLARAGLEDNGARYRCTLTNPLGFALSEGAVLTVLPDVTAPQLASVFNASVSNVVVRYTEPVRTNTAWALANYTLSGGVQITAAGPGADAATVVLVTTPLTVGTVYTLNVSGVTDIAVAANPVAPNTQASFTALGFGPVDIGRPATPGLVEAVPGGVDITAVGAGAGGTSDQFHFSQQQRTGDFDVQVRLESLELGTLFAQAGLMARQSLSTNSPFAAALATPGLAGSQFTWRGQTGAVAEIRGSVPVNYPQTWLRLKRQGTNFTGFASLDGADWTRLGSAGIGMSNTVYLGLVTSSRATNTSAVAGFRDFAEHEAIASAGFLPEAVEPPGPSSRRTGLVLSEIMYHPATRTDGRRLEYVELFNSDSVFADLGGFRLTGDIQFTFPEGTLLAAGAYLTVAPSPRDVRAEAVGAVVLGPWTGLLPREGGQVQLRNRSGALLLEVTYGDEAPWPAAADGAGHSLVLARPSYGEGDPRAWAASERRGGSPGRAEFRGVDPRRRVRLNEVLANTDDPAPDYLELYNHGPTAVDLGGCVLTDDPDEARFVIPAGTVIGPGGFQVWNQAELGFALSATGEAIFLVSPDGERVIDAVRFGPQLLGVSSGRVPDGGDTWALLAGTTPGTANGKARAEDIVINEILYHSPVDGRGEFVELYNRGTQAVDLGGWRFVDGIDFTYSRPTILPPGEFVVVAADATYLRTVHAGIAADRVAGNFAGNLSNGGERLALARPEAMVLPGALGGLVTNHVLVTVAEVHYGEGGRWGRWSDGDGSSLELLDPRAGDGWAGQWGDSDESGKSGWTTVDFTGRLELGEGGATELHIMLLGAGECLLDDIQVLDAGGASRVANGTFEGGVDGWVLQGNHVASGLSNQGFQSRGSLHLRASSGGDNGANRIKTVLNGGGLIEGSVATLRAKARWLRGHPDLLLRLKGNHLETVARLSVPANLGSPAAVNGRRVSNAGPAFADVAHFPVVPAALEPVRVTARVTDPDGIAALRLKYRFDPSVTIQERALRDDGREGDVVAGDGIHSAIIPGQAAGVLVAFWIEATDAAAVPVSASFPADPALGECLVRFGDEIPAGSFGTYRLWMTQRHTDIWTEREYMSNEALDGTVVYGTSRAIYNAGARYRGSPFIRPGYSGPTGALCAYVWTVPEDDMLLGSDEFNLDWLEQPGRDPTLQRERMSFWIGNQLGVPFSHQRYVRVIVNGVLRGEVYADTQQPNRDYIASWFPDATEGEIFKIDDWFEFDASVQREFNVDARLETYLTGDGRLSQTRYRWNWEKKANGGLDDDYSRLLELVEALNLPDEGDYSRRVPEVVDLDGWLRTIATRRVVADWDGYGYDRGKNTFAYLPPGGRWSLLLWDLDFSLGGGSDGASTGIYHSNDPVMERVYQHPHFGRIYLQAFADAVRGALSPGVADAVMDGNYAAFLGNRVEATSPAPIKPWIAARRSFLSRVLATNTAPWTAGAGGTGGGLVTTDQSVVHLTGTAPIEVRSISVNGLAYAPTWTSTTNWSLSIPLRAGTNQLVLGGLDRRGASLLGAVSTVQVVYTGVDERPEDYVRITEIMYEPVDPDAEFVEFHNRSSRTAFDLSGWRLEGVDLLFPGGSSLAPGEFAVVIKDRAAFLRTHGAGPRVLAEFPGRLNNAGETLRLVRPGSASAPWLTVNEVTYSNLLPWPVRAAGSGGSLQVLDPAQDNRRPGNWGAVDAAGHGHSTWRFMSLTDRPAGSTLVLTLGGVGQVHMDDVSLVAGSVPRVGTELIANGGFEAPLAPAWVGGPAAASAVDPSVQRSGRSSLRLVVPAGSSSADAALRQTLALPVVPGQLYTLSLWYLAHPEGADLSVRMEEGGLFGLVDAREVPVAAATPGVANSMSRLQAPFPDLWINEVQARGVGGVGPGWIELYNAGASTVSLGGWFLSSDPLAPGLAPFPAGMSIAPGAFMVIWADGQSGMAADGWHAGFTLPALRGSVLLSRTAGGVPSVVDHLHYDALSDGRSMGSHPDGAWSERFVFEGPTPGEPNDRFSLPVRVVFNEWMSRNNTTVADPADGDFDDWFELYNAGDEAVDLSGYSLTDDVGNPRRTVIPAGFVLAPRSVMLVWADGEPQQNGPGRELHVDFALSADGETLALYTPGGNLVDLVNFGPLGRDESQGLLPDGAVGSVLRLPTPSPRERNATAPVDEVRLTGLDVGAGGTTLTWDSVAGHTYDVESVAELGGTWIRLGVPVVATGSSTQFLDATAGDATRFYRVVRRMP